LNEKIIPVELKDNKIICKVCNSQSDITEKDFIFFCQNDHNPIIAHIEDNKIKDIMDLNKGFLAGVLPGGNKLE